MSSRPEVKDSVYKEAGPISVDSAGGNVVAATNTWTLTSANFNQTYVGQTLVVSGTANGNDGKFVIASIVSPTVITTQPQGLTDETFGIGFTAQVNFDPCWAIQTGIFSIQITFNDAIVPVSPPTIITATTDADDLWAAIKGLIKEAEMRGSITGGPFKWTFTSKGVACNPVPETLI